MARFYGIQPREWVRLTSLERASLLANVGPLRARESLEFINNIASLMGEQAQAAEYRELLARQAFADEPELLAQVLMKLGEGEAGQS